MLTGSFVFASKMQWNSLWVVVPVFTTACVNNFDSFSPECFATVVRGSVRCSWQRSECVSVRVWPTTILKSVLYLIVLGLITLEADASTYYGHHVSDRPIIWALIMRLVGRLYYIHSWGWKVITDYLGLSLCENKMRCRGAKQSRFRAVGFVIVVRSK